MLNVAVVGCGYWGPNHIRNFKALPDCDVRMVCDIDETRLTHIKDLYPETKISTNFSAIIQDKEIDAVVIATPVYLHYEFAKESLLAGKHVLVEKPMAPSVPECEALIEYAARQDLVLMVGHTFVYSVAVQKIKEIVQSGYLGDVFYIRSSRLNLGLFQNDINVAWDLAPHDISIVLYVMEQNPVSVNCLGKAHVNPGIEDVTNMTLDFSNGCFATIHSSWLDPNKIRKMTIVGSKRMLVYDDTEPLEKIRIYDKRVEAPPHYDTFAEFQYSYHYGDVHAPYLKHIEPLKTQCQHFVDCIKNKALPDSSGLDGLWVVRVLEAASESLKRHGARVNISDIRERMASAPLRPSLRRMVANHVRN